MSNKLTYMTEADWVSLLSAIREKGGTESQMTVGQAIDAVKAMQIGGGGGEDNLEKLLLGTLDEIYYENVIKIPGYVFYNNRTLTSINFPNATGVYNYAFQHATSLKDIKLDKVEAIGAYAFSNARNIKSIYLPSLIGLAGDVFYNCSSLEEVNMPMVETFQRNVFSRCNSLKYVNLPNLYQTAESTFYRCSSLALVKLPKIRVLEKYTFRDCTNLKFVWLGADLTEIVSLAFDNAKNLTDIYCEGDTIVDPGEGITVHYNITEEQFDEIVRNNGGGEWLDYFKDQ